MRRRRRGVAVAAGLLAGVAADALLGDPRRWHPVAGFGALAARAERALWRDSRTAGTAHLLVTVGPPTAVAAAVDRALRDRPAARATAVALLTWAVVGARGLRGAARTVETSVAAGDLDAGRRDLRALCGRDPSALDTDGLRRAVVESVAENTSDAGVAPVVWGALLGPAGLVGYRAVNTLDAMVGHRSARHARFGWAAARLDDVANLAPARLTAALAAALAPTVGGRTARAVAAWWRDAAAHPSPNAGPCEAAFAGALGVRLGGPTTYSYGRSDRPWLGDGPPPGDGDVDRAAALSRRVTTAAALAAAAVALGRWAR